jgi:murein tripeptide amidase MpaA
MAEIRFDRAPRFEELSEWLRQLADEYPELVELEVLGESHEGRQLWIATVTNKATGPHHDKPAIWLDGNIHATETTASVALLHLLNRLCTEYGNDDKVTRALDTRTFYIVPRVNPDGAEIVQTLPFYEWIGNGRYLPGEEQFGPGLHYADINDDGFILDMRLRDDAGDWRISDKDDRLMIPRGPDERGGEYYRIVPEGTLVDWDGGDFVVPRPQDGNLNRNYPSNWVPESQQYGSGEHPLSEPEIAGVVRWILDHPNIAGMQNYHTHSGVILRPWLTFPDSHFLGDDKHIYEYLGKLGV